MTISYWPDAIKTLRKRDKVLKKIIDSVPGEMLSSRGDAFFTLARSIAGQQISVKAADSIWKRIEVGLKTIKPQAFLTTPPEELRSFGLSQQKVNYMLHLANYFARNHDNVSQWAEWEDEQVIKELIALKGIGRWTAEMFLIFHLARPDIFPIADLALIKSIERHYNKGEKMTKQEILDLTDTWKPYRTVATWYLWRALDPVPVEY